MRKSVRNSSQYDSDLRTVRKAIYNELPETSATEFEHPFLVILSGLPGTGKSYFANRLTTHIKSAIVGSDRTRKLLISKPIYSKSEHARIFSICHRLIEDLLSKGHVTIFEATNLTAKSRLPLQKIATKLGVPSLCLVFTAPEDLIKKRLIDRTSNLDNSSYSDADWAIYSKLKPSQETPETNYWTIDSSQDISPMLDKLTTLIQSRHPHH